jgi:predicted esterase
MDYAFKTSGDRTTMRLEIREDKKGFNFRENGGSASSTFENASHFRELSHGGFWKMFAAFRVCFAICLMLHSFSSAFGQTGTVEENFVAQCDGTTQYYVTVYPDGFAADKSCDLLIVLHGHGGDRWQAIQSNGDECRAIREVAGSRRMLLVSPDYRAKTSWMGPKAEADMVQIIAELKARYKIGKTILCGGSMGGSSTLTFTALHPDLIEGVVSLNATANHLEYENFQDAIRESFGGDKAKIPLEYKNRSAEYWPERFTMPIALTTSGKDEIVPPQSVLRLSSVLQKIQPNVLAIHREETGHTTNFADTKTALNFVLDKVLPEAGKSESPEKKE